MANAKKPDPKLMQEMDHIRHGRVTIIRKWTARRKAIIEDTSGQRHISDFQFLTPATTPTNKKPDAQPRPTRTLRKSERNA